MFASINIILHHTITTLINCIPTVLLLFYIGTQKVFLQLNAELVFLTVG